MQPKIIFLGTAGDSIAVGKQLMSSGGIVVSVDNNQFHLDPGPGAILKAKEYGINPRNNIAVLTTNNSIYHCNDINAVVDAMTHSGLDRRGVVVSCKSVIQGTEDSYPYLTKKCRNYVEKVIGLEPGNRVGINNIEIKATKTKNNDDHTAIGFRLLTSKFSLGYTSQTSYCHELIDEFKGIDILILNVVSPEENRTDEGLNTQDAIKLISDIKPKLAVITGFGIKMMKADPLEETRKIQRATGVQTIAAKDGMVINPLSYDVSLRQKTLNFF